MANELLDALGRISRGDHACLFFSSPREQISVTAPFLDAGLRRDERCVFVGDAAAVESMREGLKSQGIDVEHESRKGRLIMTSERDFLDAGHWSTEKMLGFLRQAHGSALSDGFNALRAAADVSWQIGPDGDYHDVVYYEALLDQFFVGKRMVGLCEYPRHKCPPEILDGVLNTHKIAAMDTRLGPNARYLPPEALQPGRVPRGRVADRAPRPRPDNKTPGTLLIVDDDEDTLEVLAGRYRAKGYRVVVARDGPEALSTAVKLEPDLVLLDVHLPRLDGLAVFRELREIAPDVKIIVMTGDPNGPLARALADEGAVDFLRKPLDFEYLDLSVEMNLLTAS